MEHKTDEEADELSESPPDEAIDTTDEVPIIRPGHATTAPDDEPAGDTALDDEPAGSAALDDEPAGDTAVRDDDGDTVLDDDLTGDTALRDDDDAAYGDAGDTVLDDDLVGDTALRDDDDAAYGDVDDEDEWGGLAPLGPDDLAALDPSTLEEPLGDEDEGEIVELVEPAHAGPASSRTAADLTAGNVLRNHTRPPQRGWRRWVYELTGGVISPRVSRSERERSEQLAAIRTLVTQPRRIAVLSRKGGVGKTTTTLMLGQTLAAERGDRIVAVDGNPDAGSLGYRVGPERPDASITDLLNEFDDIQRYADMRRFTGQTSAGLEVLMSDDDPHISTALGEQEYTAVMSVLDRFYNLILIDTGTGILDSAIQGILDGTDQIVLVVAPSLDAARAASQTLDWLAEHGFVGLVESAVAVINQTGRSSLVDIARIEEHFWDRCGATVRVPWDRYLEAGAETELADLRPATREAYMQLAAAVARRFDT
jgi:putative peptide zinc metalloprotease protein